MVGTLVVGLLTLEKRDLALALLLRQSDGKVSLNHVYYHVSLLNVSSCITCRDRLVHFQCFRLASKL